MGGGHPGLTGAWGRCRRGAGTDPPAGFPPAPPPPPSIPPPQPRSAAPAGSRWEGSDSGAAGNPREEFEILGLL
jgi:hypothetical protein